MYPGAAAMMQQQRTAIPIPAPGMPSPATAPNVIVKAPVLSNIALANMSPQPGLLGTPAVSPMYTVGMAPMMGMNMNMGLGMMGMGMTPMPPLPPAPPMSMMVPAPLGPPPPKFDMKSDGSQVTTVYVGKIAPGVEDDFIRSLLEVLARFTV